MRRDLKGPFNGNGPGNRSLIVGSSEFLEVPNWNLDEKFKNIKNKDRVSGARGRIGVREVVLI